MIAQLTHPIEMQVRFIPERQGTFVTAFAVAGGSKLIAVAETDEKTITVGAWFHSCF